MFKKILLAVLVIMAVVLPITSASAHSGIIISAGFGGGGYGGYGGGGYYGPRYYSGYGGYYPAYYGGYYPGYYAPPPTVVYAQPPVVYAQPQQQPVAYQDGPVADAEQAAPTYTDSKGRTCRQYQTTATGAGGAAPTYGTACLQPDGTWHILK